MSEKPFFDITEHLLSRDLLDKIEGYKDSEDWYIEKEMKFGYGYRSKTYQKSWIDEDDYERAAQGEVVCLSDTEVSVSMLSAIYLKPKFREVIVHHRLLPVVVEIDSNICGWTSKENFLREQLRLAVDELSYTHKVVKKYEKEAAKKARKAK